MKQVAILSLLWGKHIPILAYYLSKNTLNRTVILPRCFSNTPVIDALQRLGAQTVILEDVINDYGKNQVLRNCVNMRAKLLDEFSQAAWKQYCERLSIPLKLTTDILSKNIKSQLYSIVFYITCLEKIREQYFFELAVTSENGTRISNTIVMWAKKYNIPSLHILHGVYYSPPYTHCLRLTTDDVIVFGERLANALPHESRERIHIAGASPWKIYTQLAQNKFSVKQQLITKYHIPPANTIIVLGTTWAARLYAHSNQNIHLKIVSTTLAAFSILKKEGVDCSLIIKDRPSNTQHDPHGQKIKDIAVEFGLSEQDYIFTESDTEAIIAGCDILISSESSIAIEAMHTATLNINLESTMSLIRGASFHAEDGVMSICGYDATQLATVIYSLMTDGELCKQQRSKMEQHLPLYNITARCGDPFENTSKWMALLAKKQSQEI